MSLGIAILIVFGGGILLGSLLLYWMRNDNEYKNDPF